MVLTHVLKYLNDNTKLKCSLGILDRKQECDVGFSLVDS
jgi:hypothetical protein